MTIVLAILGGLLGVGALGLEGGILGALVGYLLGWHIRQDKRLSELAGVVEQLRRQQAGSISPRSRSEAGAPPVPADEEPAPEPAPADQIERADPWLKERHSGQRAAPSDRPDGTPSGPSPSWMPAWTGKLMAWVKSYFTGGNLIVRVGIVVLFFGVAFLLKYASESNLLPIELRLAGVAGGGVVMLLLGWRLRQRREAYALALQGGAVGLLYLTVFAALRLYSMLPAGLAFGLLLLFVGLSALLALMQNSRVLAALASAGGFLAPVLTSTGEGSHVALFGYYLLLNAGILTIAWFRSWRILNLLGFGFTFVIGTLWGFNYYRPDYLTTTEPFLLAFFLMYVAVAVLFALRQPPDLRGLVDGTLVFGVPLAAAALQASLVKDYEYGLAFSALALGAFYLLLAGLLFRRGGAALRLLCEAFLATGVVFSTLAIPFALEGRLSAAFWALEGGAMIWIGIRQSRLTPRLFGSLLQPLAGAIYLATAYRGEWGVPLINSHYLGALLIALAGLFSAFCLDHRDDRIHRFERFSTPLFFLWGLLWWLGGNIQEIDNFSRTFDEWAWLLLLLAGTAATAELLRRKLPWQRLRIVSLGLLPAILLLLIGLGMERSHYLIGWVAAGWLLVFVTQYWLLHRLDDDWEAFHPQIRRLWHAGSFWSLTLLLTLEASWRLDRVVEGSSTWEWIPFGAVPSLITLLLLTVGERLNWPVQRFHRLYNTFTVAPVAVYLLGWAMLSNVATPGDPRPLHYLPLINPLDLAILFSLLLLVVWWRRAGEWLTGKGVTAMRALAVLGAALFLWLNGTVVRTVHHWAAVPFEHHALFDSQILQASISILWSLVGLGAMLAGTRLGYRWLWLLGAGLLGGVVAKLFLIDLANTGTIARIVSFMGVGVVLLLVGYLSPAPPRPKPVEERGIEP